MTTKMINRELIVDFMQKNNLSKTAFCKLCEISPSTLNKILTGNVARLTMRPFRKIAKIINIPTHKLLNF